MFEDAEVTPHQSSSGAGICLICQAASTAPVGLFLKHEENMTKMFVNENVSNYYDDQRSCGA